MTDIVSKKKRSEIMGGESIGEMINVVALGIQKKMSVYDFISLQVATHPLLTSAPTVYPLIQAGIMALEH